MAIAFVQQAKSGAQGDFSGQSATFGANVTAGNAIVAIVRNYNSSFADPGTISSITDTSGNTYTLAASKTTQDPALRIYVAQNISGGVAPTVTINGTGRAGSFWFLWIGEYSGVATSSVVDTGASGAVANASGVTSLASSAITTAGSGEAIVLAASQNNFTDYTAGTDFTLRDGSIGVTTSHYGGVEDYITTGTLSSYTAHITSGITNQSTVAWVALKPAAGGGGGSSKFRKTFSSIGRAGQRPVWS